MSDEPKTDKPDAKRWRWPRIVAWSIPLILLLYPLSLGPAWQIAELADRDFGAPEYRRGTCRDIYSVVYGPIHNASFRWHFNVALSKYQQACWIIRRPQDQRLGVTPGGLAPGIPLRGPGGTSTAGSGRGSAAKR
jgi:hypothetical protein